MLILLCSVTVGYTQKRAKTAQEIEQDSADIKQQLTRPDGFYANFSLGGNLDLIDGITLNNAFAELRVKVPLSERRFRLYSGIYLNRNVSQDSTGGSPVRLAITPLFATVQPTDTFINLEYRYVKQSKTIFRTENLGLYLNPAVKLYSPSPKTRSFESSKIKEITPVYSTLYALLHLEAIRRSYSYDYSIDEVFKDTVRQNLGTPVVNDVGQFNSKILSRNISQFVNGNYWDFYFGLGARYEASWDPIEIYIQAMAGSAFVNGLNINDRSTPLLEQTTKLYYNFQFSLRDTKLGLRIGGEIRGLSERSNLPYNNKPTFVLFIAEDISLDKLYKRLTGKE